MKRFVPLAFLVTIVLMGALAVSTVYGGPAGQERGVSSDVVPDSYIVVLQEDASPDDVASTNGVTRKHVYSSVFNGFSGKVPPGRLDALRADAKVVSVPT